MGFSSEALHTSVRLHDLPLTLGVETGKICLPRGAVWMRATRHRFMALALNMALSYVTASLGSVRSPVFLAFLLDQADKREGLYNILWALVFGFATLNILGLLARRFETGRNRLSFGEITAILVVGVSVLLLIWEMLGLFKIFPIKLGPH
jgi:hypothetical protein